MAVKKKEISMEESLWQSATKLRGTVETGEYKHVVLGLIFLKFASDKFYYRRQELKDEGKEQFLEMAEFYNMDNVFFLYEKSRWDFIVKNSKQNNISLLIDEALSKIEKDNPSLKGALPKNYYSSLNMNTNKLSALIDTINNINTIGDEEEDTMGRIYEYFLKKFAIAEGKGKGEFYTPKSIVNLLASLIEPYDGIIYDPCCGSGGMFIQSMKFVENHQGNKKNISIYGQEQVGATYRLAKMNLAIRGISADLGERPADTFLEDQHKDLKADYIMANPPFNLRDWRADNELQDDPRWRGYDIPPKSNANYGWILNMVSKLSDNGVAGFILSNGALSESGEEYKIRKKLVENNLIEAIIIIPRDTFYNTDISVTLWIINKNKNERSLKINEDLRKYRSRAYEILFMDLRLWGSKTEKKYIELTKEDIEKICSNYQNWQQEQYEVTYKDIPEYCKSVDIKEIKRNDFSLIPSKYIEFVDKDTDIDFDTEMRRIQQNFTELIREEEDSQKKLIEAFKVLGYDI